MTLRVVLVDDHRMIRTGVRSELDEDLQVVGEAADVPSAIAVVQQQLPDVVLLDVPLPGGQGGGGAAVLRGCGDVLGQGRCLGLAGVGGGGGVGPVTRAG